MRLRRGERHKGEFAAGVRCDETWNRSGSGSVRAVSKRVPMRARVALIAALSLTAAGCGSRTAAWSLSGVVPSTSPAMSSSSSASLVAADLCVDPNPALPAPVSPPIPGANGKDGMASTWSLDGGQAIVAPAGNAHPRVDRQQALCTLLAAQDVSHADVLSGDSGFSLVLAKVTIADRLLASPADAGTDVGTEVGVQSPAPLSSFQSRLAWVGVIDPPFMSTCGGDGFAPTSPSPPLVPYQLLILDAATGSDGLIYETRYYSTCTGTPAFGPDVSTLTVNVSVPWLLLSRDPGGLFATVQATVTSCDVYAGGVNTSRAHVGELEFDVQRPITPCVSTHKTDQVVHAPTASDPLPLSLTHAPLGYRDVEPGDGPSTALNATALLCEQSEAQGQIVAAYYPTTIGDLLSAREGPPPGHPLVDSDATKFPASAQAAWCEVKSASGYTIDIVGPDGTHISPGITTSTTFIDMTNGPPTVP